MKRLLKSLAKQFRTRRPSARLKPASEKYEDRVMMTASAISPFSEEMALPVSANEIVTASSENGTHVFAWSRHDALGDNIWAMVMRADQPILLPTEIAHQSVVEDSPAVAISNDGHFVVSWTESGGDIKAMFFDPEGTVLNEIYVASSSMTERNSEVSMDQNGTVVIKYEVFDGKWETRLKSFNTQGGQIAPFHNATPIAVGANVVSSSIARADDGRIALALGTSNGDIRLQRISSSGAFSSYQIVDTVLNGEGQSKSPDIAVDATGNGVIVWLEHSVGNPTGIVKARRFAANGDLSPTQFVATGVLPGTQPTVAMTRDGGSFLVTFERATNGTNNVEFVRMVRHGGDDFVRGEGILSDNAQRPDVSVSGLDEFVTTYIDRANGEPTRRYNDFDFEIQLNFIDTEGDIDGDGDDDTHFWTEEEKDRVRAATSRWEAVISGDLPNVIRNGEIVDDLLIDVSWQQEATFDGDGNLIDDGPLAFASYYGDSLRENVELPSHGYMVYNTYFEFDANWLGDPVSFGHTTTHEMGHALGIGTLWQLNDLVTGLTFDAAGNLTGDPRYTGANAVAAYNNALIAAGLETRDSVPLEDTGGPGSLGSHWRESVLDHELMTSVAEPFGGDRPLSEITVGTLEDLGYVVDYAGAEFYQLPGSTTNSITSVPSGNNKSNIQLDMDERHDGNDGKSDWIRVVRNVNDLEIWVNDDLAFVSPVDLVGHVSVLGSSDNDYVDAETALGIDVSVNGQSGYDRLLIDGEMGNDFGAVFNTQVNVNGQAFAFGNLESLYLETRGGDSTTSIYQLPAVSTFVARGESGDDVYRILTTETPTNTMYLIGQGGADRVEAANRSNNWEVLSSAYTRLNSRMYLFSMENLEGGSSADEFLFSNYASVAGTIDGGGGSDRLNYTNFAQPVSVDLMSADRLRATGISSIVTGIESVVGTASGLDRLTGPSTTNYWYLTGDNAGYVRRSDTMSAFMFYSVESLNGGHGTDQFRVYGNARFDGDIDGRWGTDTLSYASFNAGTGLGVNVDLTDRSATGIGGDVRGIENVTGSRYDDFLRGDKGNNVLVGYVGNDILLGMEGNDVLRGSYSGSNILVGGMGADTLSGGRNEDLLIGGYTRLEYGSPKSTFLGFAGMRSVWTQDWRSIDQRVQLLRNGFQSNGLWIQLDSRHVFDDGTSDRMSGGDGCDWFWGMTWELGDFQSKYDILN
ncbi:MAG: hypothetical protein KDA80_02445 [Planctomycetaceae bacterium]|nr:hypothetical protein [Planctomycetaceae bacterium]